MLAGGTEAHHQAEVHGGDDALFAAALRAEHVTDRWWFIRGRRTTGIVFSHTHLWPQLRNPQDADGSGKVLSVYGPEPVSCRIVKDCLRRHLTRTNQGYSTGQRGGFVNLRMAEDATHVKQRRAVE